MATSVSNQEINDYINSILQNPSLTDAQRASTINAAAEQYGVSRDQISNATGYGLDLVNSYLGPVSAAPVNTGGISTLIDTTPATSYSAPVNTGGGSTFVDTTLATPYSAPVNTGGESTFVDDYYTEPIYRGNRNTIQSVASNVNADTTPATSTFNPFSPQGFQYGMLKSAYDTAAQTSGATDASIQRAVQAEASRIGLSPEAAAQVAFAGFVNANPGTAFNLSDARALFGVPTRNDTLTGATRNDTLYNPEQVAQQLFGKTLAEVQQILATAGKTSTAQGTNLLYNNLYDLFINGVNAKLPDATIATNLLRTAGTFGLSKAQLVPIITSQWNAQNPKDQKTEKQISDYLNLGTPPSSVSSTNFVDILNALNPAGSSFGVGSTGVKIQGESGLREGYADYVQDYLERMSGLLARRDIDPKTNKPMYAGLQFGDTGVGGYGADTLKILKDLQTQREKATGTGAYKPYQYSFTKKKTAAQGGLMSLGVEKFAEGDLVGGQTVPSTFTPPTGGYQQATYNSATMGAVAPGTYQAGTIGSTFDQNKAGAYTAPAAGKEIASTFTTPNLYSPGTIGSTFDQTKAGIYKTPTGTDEIKSTFTTPTNLYSAGNIGSTYDPVTKSYTGPGTGISTDTFEIGRASCRERVCHNV